MCLMLIIYLHIVLFPDYRVEIQYSPYHDAFDSQYQLYFY